MREIFDNIPSYIFHFFHINIFYAVYAFFRTMKIESIFIKDFYQRLFFLKNSYINIVRTFIYCMVKSFFQ
ncbi:hypothetical protein NV64_18815 [Erwinia sp. B116]|nr:hypothetical protein NV64_18815 [Erwinia sp. B116]